MKGEKKYYKASLIADKLYSDVIKNNENKQKLLYSEYLKLIREAAYAGNVNAQYDLAGYYEDIGYWGVPNPYYNSKKKFYWYTKAVNNNHAAAHDNLADMYEKGEYCSQDIRKAAELYKRAAELGDFCGKKNYNLLLRQVNSAIFARVLFDIKGANFISEILTEKLNILTSWKINNEGLVIKLVSTNFQMDFFYEIEEYLKKEKIRFIVSQNRYSVIKIDFPKTLMYYYKGNKITASGKILSPIEYLKYNIDFFYPLHKTSENLTI